MKYLFKLVSLGEEPTSDNYWTLQEVLDVLNDKVKDAQYKDILVWTEYKTDDRGNSTTELHFGINDNN